MPKDKKSSGRAAHFKRPKPIVFLQENWISLPDFATDDMCYDGCITKEKSTMKIFLIFGKSRFSYQTLNSRCSKNFHQIQKGSWTTVSPGCYFVLGEGYVKIASCSYLKRAKCITVYMLKIHLIYKPISNEHLTTTRLISPRNAPSLTPTFTPSSGPSTTPHYRENAKTFH